MQGTPQHQPRQADQPFNLRPMRISHLVAVLCASGMLGAMPAALAQDAPAKMDSVVVTGTLIRGAAPVGAPVAKLDRDAIE